RETALRRLQDVVARRRGATDSERSTRRRQSGGNAVTSEPFGHEPELTSRVREETACTRFTRWDICCSLLSRRRQAPAILQSLRTSVVASATTSGRSAARAARPQAIQLCTSHAVARTRSPSRRA